MQNTGSTKRLYAAVAGCAVVVYLGALWNGFAVDDVPIDRKSTRLNSSHSQISYAVFCLKKKTEQARVGNCLAAVLAISWGINADEHGDLPDAARLSDADREDLGDVPRRLFEYVAVRD